MAVPDEQVRHQRNARGDRDIRQSDNPGVAILDDYPGLEPEDIRACLAYAHAVVADDRLEDVAVASG